MQDFRISPDGSTVVYLADETVPGAFELYRVPIGGGASTRVTPALVPPQRVAEFTISPDGGTVAYTANQELSYVDDLYSIPIGGGTPVKLSPGAGDVVPAGAQTGPVISPDGSTVVYLSDHASNDDIELYSVSIDGGPSTKLNTTLAADEDVERFAVSPDGTTVVYWTIQGSPFNPLQLLSVPIGGGPSTQLNVAPAEDIVLPPFAITPDSQFVIYRSGLFYKVPLGGGTATPLSGWGSEYRLAADGRVVIFHGGTSILAMLVDDAADGDDVPRICDVCPDRADPLQRDTDGDGWGDACDCSFLAPTIYPGAPEINDGLDNHCLGDVGFGQVDETSDASGFYNATDKDEYSWPAQTGATMYEAARSTGPTFAAGCVTVTTSDPFWVDLGQPSSGAAFFYLNRALAPFAGSWGVRSDLTPRTVCP